VIVDAGRAAELLESGEVVAYPTETVMGLGADARSPAALARLCALKGSESERGFSVLVRDVEALADLSTGASPLARGLAERFWPGPLTLVLELADPAFAGVASERGVGLRCSPHPAARELAARVRMAIVSTSCNKAGDAPCRSAAEAERVFGAELPVLAGEPGGLEPSTVVALSASGGLEILREGPLSEREIHACAREIREATATEIHESKSTGDPRHE